MPRQSQELRDADALVDLSQQVLTDTLVLVFVWSLIETILNVDMNYKKLLGYGAVAVALLVSAALSNFFDEKERERREREKISRLNKAIEGTEIEYCGDLYNIAERINSNLPRRVSEISIWFKTKSEACRLVHYYKYDYRASEIPVEKFREEKVERVREGVCQDENMRNLVSGILSIDYSYFGKDGEEITTIRVEESDC